MTTTTRALSHLQSLLDLTERADTQITALAQITALQAFIAGLRIQAEEQILP